MEEGGAVNIFSFCHSIFSCYDYKPISFIQAGNLGIKEPLVFPSKKLLTFCLDCLM